MKQTAAQTEMYRGLNALYLEVDEAIAKHVRTLVNTRETELSDRIEFLENALDEVRLSDTHIEAILIAKKSL